MELDVARSAAASRADIDFAEIGVGVLQATYRLACLLERKQYQWALCIGIAGAFTARLQMGDVAIVQSERLDDLSNSQYMQGFEGAFSRGLLSVNHFPFENEILHCPYAREFSNRLQLVEMQSVTTSLLAQTTAQAQQRYAHYKVDMENMEGAAFFYVCLMHKVKFLQLRSISNVVGATKSEWSIPLALEQLATAVNRAVQQM
ncbi:Futalosine hydrolase [Bacteroidia bacterium]|nr:Futalosine hydrolase [Bacteroidia bacterium]